MLHDIFRWLIWIFKRKLQQLKKPCYVCFISRLKSSFAKSSDDEVTLNLDESEEFKRFIATELTRVIGYRDRLKPLWLHQTRTFCPLDLL